MIYYLDYINEIIQSGSFFWFCAISGTSMFLIQFLTNIFFTFDYESFDAGDVISDNIDATNHDSADARKLKWLSLQAITGFLMMFGWTAITCQNEFSFKTTVTIGISLVVGIFSVLIIRFIFRFAKKLRSSGSIYKIEDAIGKEAYVYQRIPQGGVGKISMTLQHFTHEIDAISRHSEELPSFTRVKIIEKIDDNKVVVTPL